MSQNESTDQPTPTLEAAVVVRLPGELRDALRARAQHEDRTVASLLRVAARAYLDDPR